MDYVFGSLMVILGLVLLVLAAILCILVYTGIDNIYQCRVNEVYAACRSMGLH